MLACLRQVCGAPADVFGRDPHSADRPQGGSLDRHVETGQRALRLGGLEAAFRVHARPENQGDRLYDPSGALLFDHAGDGFERPEIDHGSPAAPPLNRLKAGRSKHPCTALSDPFGGWPDAAYVARSC